MSETTILNMHRLRNTDEELADAQLKVTRAARGVKKALEPYLEREDQDDLDTLHTTLLNTLANSF